MEKIPDKSDPDFIPLLRWKTTIDGDGERGYAQDPRVLVGESNVLSPISITFPLCRWSVVAWDYLHKRKCMERVVIRGFNAKQEPSFNLYLGNVFVIHVELLTFRSCDFRFQILG